MSQTLRKKAASRNLCWLFLAMWLGVLALLPAAVADARADRRLEAALFFGGAWLFMSGVAVVGLWDYYRTSLTLDDDRITYRGLFKTTTLPLGEVDRLVWQSTRHGGPITLFAADRRLRIKLSEYERDDRLTTIRYLRSAVPEAYQSHWDMFCAKTALPLRRASAAAGSIDEPPLGEGEVRITRRRWDRFFLVAAAALLPVVAICDAAFGDPKIYRIFLGFIPFWLMMRFVTPRTGFASKRLRQERPERKFQAWSMILMMPFLALCNPAQRHPVTAALYWTAFGAWVIWAFVFARRLEKQRAARDAQEASGAALEWELGESLNAPGFATT